MDNPGEQMRRARLEGRSLRCDGTHHAASESRQIRSPFGGGENRFEPSQEMISLEDTITATAEHHQRWPNEAGGN